jgi:hypothetical protein
MTSPIHTPAGFLKVATIVSIDQTNMRAYISFRPSSAGMSGVGTAGSTPVIAQLPISYLSAGGGFIGGYPAPGTPVVVSQAEGGSHWFIVAFLARDPAAKNNIGATQIKIPQPLKPGEVSIQANTDSNINLNPDGIIIGEPRNSVTFDTTRKINLNTFDYKYFVGQGEKEISGTIKRDRKPKRNYPASTRINDPAYDDNLKIIGMDPVSDARNSNVGTAIRNPARIEKHETIYEYEDFADVRSNDQELNFYRTGIFTDNTYILNRRESRVDALSLTLAEPNYLIESVKGTVVDIFGNLVDINRDILPIGNSNTIASATKIKSTVSTSNTFNNAYEQIKRLERRSVAYHFEMNARKETIGSGPPDVTNNQDYARARSRFHFDIDKEGQIKLNVPASSEFGNIGLLTRYENYSTVYPNTKSNDPNDMVFNTTYTDILIEPFGEQIITLRDDLGNIAGPPNRFSDKNKPTRIKHGTAYHDISKTVSSLQAATFYNPFPNAEGTKTTPLGSGQVSPLAADIVSKTITVSGTQANAGGRSASLNYDGSVEINIGANTVDRQSLWADLQGGMVLNVGRDLKNNVSLAAQMDGQVLMQIGGATVPAETNPDFPNKTGRFQGSNTGWIAGVLDIRVMSANSASGEMTVIRVDNGGVQVTTPGRIVFYSAQDMLFRSQGKIEFDADELVMNTRRVTKDPGSGPIR